MIAKIKAQQSSQQSDVPTAPKPVGRPPKQVPIPLAPQQTGEMEEQYADEDEQIEEYPAQQQTPVQQQTVNPLKKETMTERERIAMEIELMQNNGRYRAELLFQLQGINRALSVVAGILAELNGKGSQ